MNWREFGQFILIIVVSLAATVIAFFWAVVIVSYLTGTPTPW